MRWMRLKWNHSGEEPVLIFSEIDERNREIRKIEIFRDGRKGYASVLESDGITRLADQPMPTVPNVLAHKTDGEFEPTEIDRKEFEREWSNIAKRV